MTGPQDGTSRMWITIETGDGAHHTVELAQDVVTIGRRADADVEIDDPEVSGHHARVSRGADGELVLEDLGSTNGTRVAGVRIAAPTVLAGGEEVHVGKTLVHVSATDPATAPPAPPADRTRAAAPAPVAAAAPPPGDAAVPPPPPGASVIERIKLRRSVNRALALAIGGVVIAIVAVALAVSGVFGGSDKTTVADVVKAASPSTLLIIGERQGKPYDKGTGWVLDGARGLVVTNNHVVQGGETLKVGVPGEETGSLGPNARDAKIVGAAPCEDIAVIRVSGATLKTLQLGRQGDLQAGEQVVGLGYPANASLRDNLVATSGVVSVPKTVYVAGADVPELPNVVQTDAAINPGNSGGPLIDLDKKLVGMNTAGLDASGGRVIQGQGYAIGVDRIRQIAASLRQGRSIGWAGLGLEFPDQGRLAALGLPVGLLVDHTEAGSPASRVSALNSGTVLLTAINGKPIDTTLKSYCAAVTGIRSGETATLTIVPGPGQAPLDVPMQFG